MTVTMTREQYEQLLRWSRTSTFEAEGEESLAYLQLRKAVDGLNGLRRFSLVVRFEPLSQRSFGGSGMQPGHELRYAEFDRPPVRDDVIQMLANEQYSLSSVHVSADPRGMLGFYELDLFPFGG